MQEAGVVNLTQENDAWKLAIEKHLPFAKLQNQTQKRITDENFNSLIL